MFVVRNNLDDIVTHLENRCSDFVFIKRMLSYVLIFIENLKCTKRTRTKSQVTIDVNRLKQSNDTLIKLLQEKHFSGPSDASLVSLDPFIDSSRLLRAGGRPKRSCLPDVVKYPLIDPKSFPITLAMVRYFHDKVLHSGRGVTMSEIRDNGL